MRTINIEAGMPSSQQAMTTLNNRIYAERASGAKGRDDTHRVPPEASGIQKTRHDQRLLLRRVFGTFQRGRKKVCREVPRDQKRYRLGTREQRHNGRNVQMTRRAEAGRVEIGLAAAEQSAGHAAAEQSAGCAAAGNPVTEGDKHEDRIFRC